MSGPYWDLDVRLFAYEEDSYRNISKGGRNYGKRQKN